MQEPATGAETFPRSSLLPSGDDSAMDVSDTADLGKSESGKKRDREVRSPQKKGSHPYYKRKNQNTSITDYLKKPTRNYVSETDDSDGGSVEMSDM